MVSKPTFAIAAIVAALLVVAGRYSVLLIPGAVGWLITTVAGHSVDSRSTHTLLGMLATFFLMVQLAVLIVLLIAFEQGGDSTAKNPPAIALIGTFVLYVVALVMYFGRGPREPSQP